jgi:hypothetical protein
MLRGCLLALGLYAVLAVAYFYWLSAVFEPPATYMGAGIAALLVWLCLGSLGNARTALRDWSLLTRSQHNPHPADGQLMALAGTIHPVRESLAAPFSRSECVICEYDLCDQARIANTDREESAGSDYAGFLMVPCVVRSGFGEVKILGYPILEGFTESVCTGASAARNALEFLQSNSFEDRTGLKMVTLLSVFGDVWTDDDGSVQKNLQLRQVDLRKLFPEDAQRSTATPNQWEPEAQPVHAVSTPHVGDDEDDQESEYDDELDDDPDAASTAGIPKMTEKRVDVGEEVCVIGIYDEMKRGLLPPGRGRHPNRLLLGSIDAIARQLRGSILRNVIGSLVALVVIHAVIYGAMQIYLRSPEGQRRHGKQALATFESRSLAPWQLDVPADM